MGVSIYCVWHKTLASVYRVWVRIRDRVRARVRLRVWAASMYRLAIRTAIIADLPILEGTKLQ